MQNTNVTTDKDFWQIKMGSSHDPSTQDAIIFNQEICNFATGFMTESAAKVDSYVITAVPFKCGSVEEATAYLAGIEKQHNIYLHKILHRYVVVEGYQINDIIIYFATTPKD